MGSLLDFHFHTAPLGEKFVSNKWLLLWQLRYFLLLSLNIQRPLLTESENFHKNFSNRI